MINLVFAVCSHAIREIIGVLSHSAMTDSNHYLGAAYGTLDHGPMQIGDTKTTLPSFGLDPQENVTYALIMLSTNCSRYCTIMPFLCGSLP